MNIVKFEGLFNKIEEGVSITNHNLKYKKYFSEVTRKTFDVALRKVEFLLDDDRAYLNRKPIDLWQTAYRIVLLDHLYVKIKKVYNKILDLPPPRYFCKKLNELILPDVAKRINNLILFMTESQRLPFKIGNEREMFYQNVEKMMEVHETTSLLRIEREFFHFLGNQLNEEKLKKINTEMYNGSLDIYSLVSWSKILEVFVKEGDHAEQVIGQGLLKMINEAIPITNKLSFLSLISNLKELNGIEPELAYFQDMVDAYDKSAKHRMTQADFFEKYTLGLECSIPLMVLENEIAWDIVEAIDQMKESESRVFTLGCQGHSLAIRVTCFDKGSSLDPGIYKYEIFNTGKGILKFHHRNQDNTLVLPVTFDNVSKRVLDYSFFVRLVRHALIGEDIDYFYNLHDEVLVKKGGAIKRLDAGIWYLIQKHGICTYTDIEAWINSYLNEKQLKHLEIIKARISTEKQEQVVVLLEENLKEEASWNSVGKSTQHIAKQIIMTKTNKLEESRTLLELGKAHLESLTNNISPN